MADTGLDLVSALAENDRLLEVRDCSVLAARILKAIYCADQPEPGLGTWIRPGDDTQRQINTAIGFGGANSETAVLHFLAQAGPAVNSSLRPPIHHFVAIPWYNHGHSHGQVYTVFMAYANKYSLEEYLNGTGSAPQGENGYKLARTASGLSRMLSDLLTSGEHWQGYFGQVGTPLAERITYWKHKAITLKSAIDNARAY